MRILKYTLNKADIARTVRVDCLKSYLKPGFQVILGAVFEPRIVTASYTEAFQYHWNVRDHLGNFRLIYSDEGGKSNSTYIAIKRQEL